MKKIISLFAVAAMATSAAVAAPSHITRAEDGSYTVTFDYEKVEKKGFYIGARADMNFMNWKNEYTFHVNGVGNYGVPSDKYSFEPVFGGSIAGGYTFNYFWRAELELGYMGKFEDSGQGADFALSVPYMMANLYYDFVNDFYVGGGLGLALPKTDLSHENIIGGDFSEKSVSPMLGLMVGYTYQVDDNLKLDLRYRLAGLWGPTHEGGVEYDTNDDGVADASGKLETDIGLILDNSFSVGVRYEF